VRNPSGSFFGTHCIYASGWGYCPAGSPYSERTHLYQTIQDDRDCTSCGCGPAFSVSCEGTTTLYADANCTTALETVPNDGSTCVSHATAAALQFTLQSGPTGGLCPDYGGQPTGSATATGRLTLCCLP
jgi:hypothetical protein